jgi:hypothetical protein|uniref:Fibronectin n=1 Tax=Myoviridae sp. ctTYJ16 TaxID=2825112 RepID=A0A8S5P9B6_9CAUD|nr:MAG TPA: fibronectin [Myoviridae sp. ctTYJ16]
MAEWVNEVSTSQGGNISMKVAGGYTTVTRVGNTISCNIGVRFISSQWTYNSIVGWYDGVRKWAQRSEGGHHTATNGTYYCDAGDTPGIGYQNTSETTPWSFSTTVSGRGAGEVSVTIGTAWNGWKPNSSKYNYQFSIPYPAVAGDPVYSRSVSGITRTSATLNISCTSNPTAYWRIHWYNTNAEWVGYSGNGATGNWTYTQDNLAPNTTYNFYTQVTNNDDGEGTGLSPISFTTSGNAPVLNSVAVSPSRTTAVLSPNVSYDTNASFSSYSIRYGTSTNYGSTSTSTTISGLTPNTTYYYSITVTDNWGRTSVAKTGSFKTTGNNPTINSHGVKTYAQTSVEMQYSASYDTNDSLSSYKWEYGTSTSYGSSVTGTNIINGLSANTTYYYKLVVTSAQGRNSTATGSFKTDPATVSINSLGFSDITETSVKITYYFNNPSGLSSVYVINTNISAEGVGGQNIQTSFAPIPFSQTVTDLVPGTKYTCMVRVGIRGQGGTIYYSDWANGEFETLANTPFAKIDSNGTIKYYKGYALGKSDIYNGYNSEWKNGNYSETIGSSISFDGEGMGVSKVKHIEIMGGSAYTYEFPIEQFISSPSVTLILTNSSDIVQKVVKVIPGQSDSINTDSSTRLYITCTGTDLNKETARYVRFSIYRSISKVPLDKESIVTLNNKIRYIDISQNGYIKGTTTGSDGKIIELDVYDKLGNNIALNKNVTMEKGSGSNLEKITDGNHDGSSYCTLNENSAGTTVRVDLGQEYSYDQIDRVVLWRDVDCLYQESRLLGLDANKQITWKFQSYKSEGVYKETSEGYTARPRKAKTKHNIYITSLLNELDSPPFADKITINADWNMSIPPVIADLTTHRVDAIIAANSGRLLKNDVGDLTALTTTEKSNLVDAINEIWNGINKTEEEFTVLDFVLESILCG